MPQSQPQNHQSAIPTKPRLLIIEDSAVLREALVQRLLVAGWTAADVTVCASADAALTALRDQTFDAVIADNNLGDGQTTGSVLFSAFRHQYWHRWILFTADPEDVTNHAGMFVVDKCGGSEILLGLLDLITSAPRPQLVLTRSAQSVSSAEVLRTLDSDFGPRAGFQPPTMDVPT